MRKSVTIPCLFPRRSLTPYHRRIESLNASSCHAYSISERNAKVKPLRNIYIISRNQYSHKFCVFSKLKWNRYSSSSSSSGASFSRFFLRTCMTIRVPIAMTIPPAKRMICSVGMADSAFSFDSEFCSVVAGACVRSVESAVFCASLSWAAPVRCQTGWV